jgi:LCP family protein required for cell wall assembly
MKWKHALDNVDAMRVVPMVLPTTVPKAPSVSANAAKPAPEIGSAPPVAQPQLEPTTIPRLDQSMNILLLGTDARIGDDVSRTDAIILVHLDAQTERVSMLSFPRDLWVTIPGYGKNKINAAYPTGEKQLGPGYGAALAKETVSQLTGLPVEHFVMINFDGFKTLIDKLGGISIDVPKAITDNAYPVDEYPGDIRTKKIHFDAGRQLMDGDTALIYARTRHADSDFGRNQRQQQVLMAIFEQIRHEGLMSNLTNVDAYTDALRDYVRTDLSRNEMLRLAGMGPSLDASSIQRYTISPKMVSETTNPYRLVLSDAKGFQRLVDEMLGETVAAAGGEEP